MGEPLPMVYDLTLFDESGSELGEGSKRVRFPLAGDIEREVQFREVCEAAGASRYEVHFMTPKEVKQLIKEERGSLLDQYLEFVAETIGLDKALTVLPLVTQSQEIVNTTV